MALRRPRRIFGSSSRSAAARGPGFMPAALSNTVVVGLLGAVGGAALVLFAGPSELFGRAAPLPSEIRAEAPQIAVIDGETLRLRDTVIRLLGIKAPPHGAQCRHADGSPFDCGDASADALAQMVRDHGVTCRLHGHDDAGRPLGICDANGRDLNRAQVDQGFARASAELPGLERGESDARTDRRGLWAGNFDPRS